MKELLNYNHKKASSQMSARLLNTSLRSKEFSIIKPLRDSAYIFRKEICLVNWKKKTAFFNNLGQNICRLFHFLAKFFFTTNETELDYYHQKLNVRVASRVSERLKNQEISRKILIYLDLMTGTQPATQKPNCDVFWKKS